MTPEEFFNYFLSLLSMARGAKTHGTHRGVEIRVWSGPTFGKICEDVDANLSGYIYCRDPDFARQIVEGTELKAETVMVLLEDGFGCKFFYV